MNDARGMDPGGPLLGCHPRCICLPTPCSPCPDNVLSRIKALGYNAIQLMAIQVRRKLRVCGAADSLLPRPLLPRPRLTLLPPIRVTSAEGDALLPPSPAPSATCLPPPALTPLVAFPPPPLPPFTNTQEHAYYGSFGYHVTNPFAVSSRSGVLAAGGGGGEPPR